MIHSRRTMAFAALAASVVAAWLVLAGTGSASTKPPATAAATAQEAGNFVGEETCLTCHEDRKQGYHGSPHARARDPRTPAAAQGCESCHGPGKAHVDSDGDKTKIKRFSSMPAREVSATCVTCHNRSTHSEWVGGKHDARNVSCVTCHSVHAFKSEKAQLKTATQQETCVQCHRNQVNKVHRSSHMPVLEGKLECSSCHNPHGSKNVKMLKEGNSITEACVSCHSEKRGPFLWEHAVGRENCVTCHDPHGSNNERLLVAKVPMLCQRCHVHTRHPATVYDQLTVNNRSNRVVGRGCVNCHAMVHGSNHPSGNFFLR
jgi:DmsE family decaheme c-type cytochrome